MANPKKGDICVVDGKQYRLEPVDQLKCEGCAGWGEGAPFCCEVVRGPRRRHLPDCGWGRLLWKEVK